jgi:hypothetical protein
MLPENVPVAAGWKMRFNEQLAPAARVLPQVLEAMA